MGHNRKPRDPSPANPELLETVARLAAVVLERLDLKQALREHDSQVHTLRQIQEVSRELVEATDTWRPK